MPVARVDRFSTLCLGGGCNAGALWWVSTAITPGTASAAAVSMPVIGARVTVAQTSAACARSVYRYSAE